MYGCGWVRACVGSCVLCRVVRGACGSGDGSHAIVAAPATQARVAQSTWFGALSRHLGALRFASFGLALAINAIMLSAYVVGTPTEPHMSTEDLRASVRIAEGAAVMGVPAATVLCCAAAVQGVLSTLILLTFLWDVATLMVSRRWVLRGQEQARKRQLLADLEGPLAGDGQESGATLLLEHGPAHECVDWTVSVGNLPVWSVYLCVHREGGRGASARALK